MAGKNAPDSGNPVRRNEVAELLSSYLPYLSQGFCEQCKGLLERRIENLASSSGKINGISKSQFNDNADNKDISYSSLPTTESSRKAYVSSTSKSSTGRFDGSPDSRYMSKPASDVKSSMVTTTLVNKLSLQDESSEITPPKVACEAVDDLDVQDGSGLSREQRDQMRFSQVGRKRDFSFIERVNGRPVNILQGLELHTQVFNASEQKKIVDYVYKLQRMGQKGQLRERTYSEPRKWMRGKGRITIQFGCCYNYAVDKNGNPPGIIRDEEVDPIPPLFKTIIKRLVRWHVLPPSTVPNSCIVNIYDEGDCIPPHIDHHDFLRPFCTVSFLTECNILFGSNLKIAGPGEFTGPVKIPLPVGSVLILNGNGADVAKHCVPAVPAKRISITFRKMDESKIPYSFSPDPELQGLQPLVPSLSSNTPVKTPSSHHLRSVIVAKDESGEFKSTKDDFPPLGSGMSSVSRPRYRR